MRFLRCWSETRLAIVSLGWIILVFGVSIARTTMAARALARAHPGADSYIIGTSIPGGGLLLLGPPVVLVAAWLWARRGDRAS